MTNFSKFLTDICGLIELDELSTKLSMFSFGVLHSRSVLHSTYERSTFEWPELTRKLCYAPGTNVIPRTADTKKQKIQKYKKTKNIP